MEEADDNLNSSVGFLYKTMLERDPCKRRVKPVKPHLLQIDFAGLDNSSDDSDFNVDNETEDDDDDNDVEDDVDNDDDDENENDDKDEEDEFREDDDHANSSITSVSSNSSDGNHGTHLDLYVSKCRDLPRGSNLASICKPSYDKAVGNISLSKLKVSVCCVCLGDTSILDNEIVECDSCGASVHEGCYGIAEIESIDSSASSASTEPWFCDACKAGIKPRCELCPNSGGIFKETDAGRWVHLVCALYIPGVAFGDVDKLSAVTIFEMSYTKWGAKDCSLCDDERFMQTGVCIGCDAGLCRSYFHVTCAQREGLLTEASPDEDIADPFFAYCKQHVDKASVRKKRQNWLAVQSNMKNFEYRFSEKEKLRVQKKLTVHQHIFTVKSDRQQTSWVPTVKMPRLLVSSSYAVSQLLKKAELLGLACTQTDVINDLRKKSQFSPMLSTDFVTYFLDRNVRICNLKQRVNDLSLQKQKLQAQEGLLHNKYELLTQEISNLKNTGEKLQYHGEKLWNIVTLYSSEHIQWSGIMHYKQMLKTSPKKVTMDAVPSLLQRCDICKKTHDQHLLAKCDKCNKNHHLRCLDPPLTRMPKKTKLQGWQCSRCHSTTDEDTADIDTNEPRRLRRKVHEPFKYTSLLMQRTWSKKDDIKCSQTTSADQQCKICHCLTEINNYVKCDNCHCNQHLNCLDPPRTRSPRVRGYVWFCDDCLHSMKSVVKNEHQVKHDDQLLVASDVKEMHKSVDKLLANFPMKRQLLVQTSSVKTLSAKRRQLTSTNSKRLHNAGLTHSRYTQSSTVSTSRTRCTNFGTRLHCEGKKSSPVKRSESFKRLKSFKHRSDTITYKTSERIKLATEREFFYSSRNDPMRRPFPPISTNSVEIITVTDDESG